MNAVDINKYRVNVPYVESLCEGLTGENLVKMISEVAVASSVPIIAVCCYVGEAYGFDDSLLGMIQRLKKFYNIDTVINIKVLGEL